MARERLRVDRGGGDDQLEILAAREQAFQIAEQEIDVQAALVGFVDDDRVVFGEVAVALRFGEQDAVGHQLDVSLRAGAIVEADLAADLAAPVDVQLLGDAARDGKRGHAARLRAADLGFDAQAGFEAHLGNLRGLARTGFAGDDDHLVVRMAATISSLRAVMGRSGG